MSGTKGHSGGYRRRHTLPALSPQQVAQARELHAQGRSYKEIMRVVPAGRTTIWRAIMGTKAYKGYT